MSLMLLDRHTKQVDKHNIVISRDNLPHTAVTTYTTSMGSSPKAHEWKGRTTFKVMSLNLFNYNHWELRIPLLQSIVQAEQPDVIGLQEVRARKVSPHYDHRYQIETLHQMFPSYQFVYQPAMRFAEGASEIVHEGVAILSRYPILDFDHLLLSYVQSVRKHSNHHLK